MAPDLTSDLQTADRFPIGAVQVRRAEYRLATECPRNVRGWLLPLEHSRSRLLLSE